MDGRGNGWNVSFDEDLCRHELDSSLQKSTMAVLSKVELADLPWQKRRCCLASLSIGRVFLHARFAADTQEHGLEI